MNGSCAKVRRLLAGPEVTAVVVEYRDRLGRMNTELRAGVRRAADLARAAFLNAVAEPGS